MSEAKSLFSLLQEGEVVKPPKRPWPIRGRTYEVWFYCEHIGKFWDDTPTLHIRTAPECIVEAMSDFGHSLELRRELIEGHPGYALPIASGLYRCRLEYYQTDSWENPAETEWGFYLTALHRMRS